jgi:FHA domain-containing protein
MDAFAQWFYYGFGGTGGWVIWLALGAAACVWVVIDSARRRLPAAGWRLGTFVAALALITPAALTKVLSGRLPPVAGMLAVAGVLGGLIPAAIAAVYLLRFRGLTGCVKFKSHKPYRADLKECPMCARSTVQGLPGIKVQKDVSEPKTGSGRKTSRGASKSSKPRSEGWLVDDEGSVYQINQGDTSIGRAPQNDIRLWEGSASRTHAKIVENNNTFTIYDLGSVAGTWLNDQRVRRPEQIKSGDVLTFGTSTQMTFTTKPGDLP